MFLNGHEKEARGQYIRGTLALTVAQGESVKNIQLSLMKTVSAGLVQDKNGHSNIFSH